MADKFDGTPESQISGSIAMTEEETVVVIDHLPLYLDVALEECVLALARQQLRRRTGNGERPGGTGD